MGQRGRKDREVGKYAYAVLGGGWSVLSLISINHIVKIVAVPFLSVTVLGLMAWGIIILTLTLLCRPFCVQGLLVFFLFFSFGIMFGPFLEPPADSFEHLRRTHSYCEKKVDELPHKNKGFWQYSMSAVLLCSDSNAQHIDTTLLKLDLLHGVYQGIIVTALFVLAKSAGLPDRWAFLSCCISFLFFGTNRFSYFSYYSFAPTYSSMLIYWLWTALFFFKKKWPALVAGFLAALMVMPILWVNHVQEVFLLCLLVFVWLSLNFHEYVWDYLRKFSLSRRIADGNNGMPLYRKICIKVGCLGVQRGAYLGSIFLIFFFLPQWKFFQDVVSSFFVRNLWIQNQKVVFSWMDFHLFGKVWDFRVNDTFGSVGLLIMLLAVPFFCTTWIRRNSDEKVRIFLLAILPFVGYCIPLIHFVWLSNVVIPEYYRLSYASMFWLFFAYLFWGLESRAVLVTKKICRRWFN